MRGSAQATLRETVGGRAGARTAMASPCMAWNAPAHPATGSRWPRGKLCGPHSPSTGRQRGILRCNEGVARGCQCLLAADHGRSRHVALARRRRQEIPRDATARAFFRVAAMLQSLGGARPVVPAPLGTAGGGGRHRVANLGAEHTTQHHSSLEHVRARGLDTLGRAEAEHMLGARRLHHVRQPAAGGGWPPRH